MFSLNNNEKGVESIDIDLKDGEILVFFPIDEQTGKPIPSKFPYPRIKRLHFLSGFELMMITFNLAVMLSTVPYFAMVSLNVVFTNKYLRPSDYGCYDPTLIGELGGSWSDQLWPDWWIYLSDFLYIVTPIFQMYILFESNISGGDDQKNSNYWYLGVTIFIKVVTAAARIYQAVFCFYFNICRNCPGECTSSTNCPPNQGFTYALSYNIIYLAVLMLYAIVSIGGLYTDSVVEYLTEQYDNIRLLSIGGVMIEGQPGDIKGYVTPRLLGVGRKLDDLSLRINKFSSKVYDNYRFGLRKRFQKDGKGFLKS